MTRVGLLEGLEKAMKRRTEQNAIDMHGKDAVLPIVKLEDISFYIRKRQQYRLDAFVMCNGDNGTGKSIGVGLPLLKMLKRQQDHNYTIVGSKNIMYAEGSHRQFINAITDSKNEIILCDETGTFMGAGDQMTTEQKVCYSQLEVCRSNQNAMIFLSKDFFTTNFNLRNGKIGLLVWIWDRKENDAELKIARDEGERSVAYVFLANNIMRSDDKFGLEPCKYAKTFDEWRMMAEMSPSFLGVMYIDDCKDYLTDDELKYYEEHKDIAAEARRKISLKKMEQKEKAQDNAALSLEEKAARREALKQTMTEKKRQEHIAEHKRFLKENPIGQPIPGLRKAYD